MKNNIVIILVIFALIGFAGCEKKPSIASLTGIEDVGLKVSFGGNKAESDVKSSTTLTCETPGNYYVALKKATLLGTNETSDVVLFSEADLSSSFVFDYKDDNTVHSLLDDSEIPDGEYTGIEIEIYYLQMNIAVATDDRGTERRNIRIYLSDDAETEGGVHQPGDMTQINEGQEIGWLLGEGQIPNMDPVAPREAAYTEAGQGIVWYDFAGKSGENYGPFGDIDFMNNSPHPIYKTTVDFTFVDNNGTKLVLDFNVNDCWQFEDKSGDGIFGADDMDPDDPTEWHMALPEMTITLQ